MSLLASNMVPGWELRVVDRETPAAATAACAYPIGICTHKNGRRASRRPPVFHHIRIRCKSARLFTMARPLAVDLITCPKPAKAVPEIAGGESAKHGIQVGDSVRHAVLHC